MAFEEAEAALRAWMERSLDPVVVHRAGRVVFANQAVAGLLGYGSAAELLGVSVIDLTHPDDRERVRARIQRMLTHQEPAPLVEERFLRRDGTAVPVDVLALPIVFEGKLSILVSGHDARERKWLEAEKQRLFEEQARLGAEAQRHAAELQAILDHQLAGLIVFDRTGRVTMTNLATAKLFGSQASELGATLEEMFAKVRPYRPNGQPYALDELPSARAFRGEQTEGDNLTVADAQGNDHYLSVSASPIRDEEGNVTSVVSVMRDVTEMVEFDRLKDQFLRVVAHELKTPVAIMKGYAQLLLRSPEEAASRRMLEKIDRGADRIDRIVRDMLDLSQLHLGNVTIEHEKVELDAVVDRIAQEMARSFERHQLKLSARPVVVEGDGDRLGKVVGALIDNAVRYSPQGGRIEVTCGPRRDEAVVSVKDEGVGIPADKQARVFERFFRAHTDTPNDYGGMGVGLYLAREIVRRHGGEMWFESREGIGSVFSFSLPLGGER